MPRGVNYINLIQSDGRLEDCVFRVGDYNPAQLEQDFATLAGHGYNTVRLFLDTCNTRNRGIGSSSGQGLNPEYLDNLADGMRIAREHGIFLLLISNDLPDRGGYWELSSREAGPQFGPYRNSHYLTTSGVESAKLYWRDLLRGLAERGAAFDAVLAWQLLNEQWYFNNDLPLSLETRTVTTANGQSYDMGSEAEKRQMLADSIRFYMEEVISVIHGIDPSALVTMGFFSTPGGGTLDERVDFRYADTASIIHEAPLDFFDFHAYPGGGQSLQSIAVDFGMLGYDEKPIILGEFGAFQHIYDSPNAGARAAAAWMAASCELGFDGWLYWTYRPAPLVVGDSTYGFVNDGDLIMEALAPAAHPDPCAIPLLPSVNLALEQSVRASRFLAGEEPELAVDGSAGTQWGSGAEAPQWIQVESPEGAVIGEIRLRVAQYPAGHTLHRVYAIMADGSRTLIAEFDQETTDDQWLAAEFDPPLEGLGAIRIETVSSPSWVSWEEIQFYAP